jgi:LDH2 family malate/lactate/ureidoglycolate dehydrogenase
MQGSSGVLYPGEIEENNRRERLANGVDIEQATWDAVAGLVKQHGLEEELGPLP